jgi:hypothetical protein
LKPAQFSTQWVSEAVPVGLKQQERETYHSPLSSAEVKAGEAVPPPPISLRGVALTQLRIIDSILVQKIRKILGKSSSLTPLIFAGFFC